MTSPSDLAEWDLFLGTGEWHEEVTISDRAGLRCLCLTKAKDATPRAYFGDGGQLVAMAVCLPDGEVIEVPADKVAQMARQVLESATEDQTTHGPRRRSGAGR